jgi:Glycosyl hydrolases family 28
MFKKPYLSCLFLWLTTFVQAQDTNITDFGAKSDGTTINTEAIQKAIDQTAVKGGRVVIPQGEFLSGTIYLKSNVTLYIQKGGMLKGSPNLKDYPENTPSVKGMKPHRAFWKSMPSKALVYADNADNIGLMGEGIIDGNGKSPAFLTKDDDPNRPKLIFVVNCRKVRVENLRFQNTAFWLQHYFACDGVIIKGLNIYNHGNKNVDGIDIDSKNVVVSDCIIDCDDDALCFKSDGNFLCENVVVTNCVLSTTCNFIKMGTASYTGFKNISITNCVLKRPSESLVRDWSKQSRGIADSLTGLAGIALEIVDGGMMDKINISNIVMSGLQTPIFIKLGSRMNPTGSIRNVNISNIMATAESFITSSITAVPGFYVDNVVLSNIQFFAKGFDNPFPLSTIIPENEKNYPENRMFGDNLPAYGFYLRHVKNIYFNNVQFTLQGKDNRPAFHIEDAANIQIRDCKVEIPENKQPVINLLDVNGLYVSNIFYSEPIPLLFHVSGTKSGRIKVANESKKSFKYILDKGVSKDVFIE